MSSIAKPVHARSGDAARTRSIKAKALRKKGCGGRLVAKALVFDRFIKGRAFVKVLCELSKANYENYCDFAPLTNCQYENFTFE
jgi:hypothetical protein